MNDNFCNQVEKRKIRQHKKHLENGTIPVAYIYLINRKSMDDYLELIEKKEGYCRYRYIKTGFESYEIECYKENNKAYIKTINTDNKIFNITEVGFIQKNYRIYKSFFNNCFKDNGMEVYKRINEKSKRKAKHSIVLHRHFGDVYLWSIDKSDFTALNVEYKKRVYKVDFIDIRNKRTILYYNHFDEVLSLDGVNFFRCPRGYTKPLGKMIKKFLNVHSLRAHTKSNMK